MHDGFVARSGLTPAELEALRTFRTPLT